MTLGRLLSFADRELSTSVLVSGRVFDLIEIRTEHLPFHPDTIVFDFLRRRDWFFQFDAFFPVIRSCTGAPFCGDASQPSREPGDVVSC